MKLILLIILSIYSTFIQAKKIEPLIFISNECKVTLVSMFNGNIKTVSGEENIVICDEEKNFNYSCKFNDSKGKLISTENMIGTHETSDGVIASKKHTDIIFYNSITKIFYQETTINIENGAIRGKKICTGKYLTESEYNKLKKP